MKIFRTVILGIFLLGMLVVYVVLLWSSVFPTDSEMEKRIPIMEERAEKREKGLERLKIESMNDDD